MTGNNKVWRAPLAGLAAVAMLATMGVAASTANAATLGDDVKVTVAGATVATAKYGESLKQALDGVSLSSSPTGYGWVDKNSKPVDFSAPLTGDVELKQAAVAAPATTATVTFTANGSATAYYPGGTTLTKVDASENIPQDFLPSYPGYAVTAWKVTPTTGSVQGDAYTLTAADVEKDGLELRGSTGTSYAIEAQIVKTTPVKFTTAAKRWKNSDANVTGLTESDTTLNDGWFDADVAKNGVTVEAPEFVYAKNPATSNNKVYTQWTNGKQTIKAGEPIPADADTTDVYVPDASSATVTYRYTVTFDTNGGSNVDTQYVNKGETVKKPADPTRDGYVFQGWKSDDSSLNTADGFYAFDSEVKKDLELTAEWAKTADIKVTFSAGSFAGAGDDKSITVAGDAFVDESQAPKFTREGYTYDSWFLDTNVNGKQEGSETVFDFTTTLAGKANGGKNFTLVPVWERADANKAKNALKYVQPDGNWAKELDVNYGIEGYKNNNDEVVPNWDSAHTIPVYGYNANFRSDNGFFTESSFDEFAKVYKAQYQKYVSAAYKNGSENTNEVDAKTSAEIVSALQDAWKGLRFDASKADTVLDDSPNNTDPAKVIYRLFQPATGSHLYTGDEHEVRTLTNKYSGQGGWTLDKTNFRAVNGPRSEWISGKVSDVEFTPLVKQVSRFFNGREHLYTADPAEQAALLKSGWSQDSDKAAILVPALYTTDTKVTRLFNPAQGLHLYTSNSNEINVLTQQGWVKDGDKASFYAL